MIHNGRRGESGVDTTHEVGKSYISTGFFLETIEVGAGIDGL